MCALNSGVKNYCQDCFQKVGLMKCSNLKTDTDNVITARMSPKRSGVQAILAHVVVA